MKVFVYRNLHKNCWSARALEGPNKGRVVWRGTYARLFNAQAKVSEAGRNRVLREKRKNVHAGIVGVLKPVRGSSVLHAETWEAISYDPYVIGHFFSRESGAAWSSSPVVILTDKAVYVPRYSIGSASN